MTIENEPTLLQQQNSVGATLEPFKIPFSVCKVTDYSGIDIDQPFVFSGRTDQEKSLVCPTDLVPDNTLARDDGWRAFRICGELDFSSSASLRRFLRYWRKTRLVSSPFQPTKRITS